MMLPASTRSSPNFLTPRRRPAESRPLREEPPAFLCAMTSSPGPVVPRVASGAGADLGDLQHRHQLAVAVLAPVVVAPPLLKDDDLLALLLLEDGGAHRGAGDERRPGARVGALADREPLGQLERRAGLALELLDADHV